MAQTIKLKRSSVSGNVPTTAQLDLGELAINTYDGKIFIKKDNGTASVVQIGTNSLLDLTDVVGDGSSGQVLTTDGSGSFSFTTVSGGGGGEVSAYSRTVVSASAGQTVFPVTYSVGFVDVYLNGVKLILSTDFTATNGSSVTLAAGAASGDTVEIIAYNGATFQQVAQFSFGKFTYIATTNQTTFSGSDNNASTLSYTPGSIDVYLNGVLLDESEYTASDGTTIVLNAGAAVNDILKVTSYDSPDTADLSISGSLTLGGTELTSTATELNLLDAIARGSIIYGNASGETAILALGEQDQILTSNGTDLLWADPTTTRFVEKTTNATLSAGDKVIVDSSSSALTMTLPASPTLGDEIAIIDGTNTAAINNITVARNGEKIDGVAADMTIDVNGAAFNIVYYNASRGWIFTER